MAQIDIEVLTEKLEAVLPHLDERQRRLLLGAEARSLGHGGIRAVARASGAHVHTVTAGIAELQAGAAISDRVRRPGGGRKPITQTDPGLVTALLALTKPEERGDPMSPLRWTIKSTWTLSDELTAQGHPVSAAVVGRLLHAEGFTLRGNAKVLEGQHHPDRDAQFRYINDQVTAFQAEEQPAISVDAKKKERPGPYATPGQTWRPAGDPVKVRDHDFTDPTAGIGTDTAIPYGIYDLTRDSGWVNVGTDHNTAVFAVESIRRWWTTTGRHDYPDATRLLITADAGGSNAVRARVWKAELAALALATGLQITVCHFPPGTSKWNKIEHRLFSHITMNWRGRPLTSHDVIVQSIAATTTRTGLHVHAELDPNSYDLGQSIDNAHYDALPLDRHNWQPDWNYTLHPRPPAPLPPPPPPTDQPSPHLTWLTHPALTGISTTDLHTLTHHLATLDTEQRHARGIRPCRKFGQKRLMTFADRVTATLIHHHLALPPETLTHLYGAALSTIREHLINTTNLLHQTQHPTPPSTTPITTLTDFHTYATQQGITLPTNIKHAC